MLYSSACRQLLSDMHDQATLSGRDLRGHKVLRRRPALAQLGWNYPRLTSSSTAGLDTWLSRQYLTSVSVSVMGDTLPKLSAPSLCSMASTRSIIYRSDIAAVPSYLDQGRNREIVPGTFRPLDLPDRLLAIHKLSAHI